MVNLPTIFENIERAKSEVEFMATGFTELDSILDGGFTRKELIVLGAFTGTGKSYIAGQISMKIARQGFKVGYFSLEISNEMVVSRMIGSIANIKPTKINYGLLTKEEFERRVEAMADLKTLQDFVYFRDDLYELNRIISEIKLNQFDFVVIDFIQNLLSEGKDEYSKMSNAALTLQKAAKENNCTILCLSQLSNEAAKNTDDNKPIEFKGSGSIATVCDLGILMKRFPAEEGSLLNIVKLYIRKNRRGISGQELNLLFQAPGGYLHEA